MKSRTISSGRACSPVIDVTPIEGISRSMISNSASCVAHLFPRKADAILLVSFPWSGLSDAQPQKTIPEDILVA